MSRLLDEGTGTAVANQKRGAAPGAVQAVWSRTWLELDEPLPPSGTLLVVR